MEIFQSSATLGLRSFATPTKTLVANSLQIGSTSVQIPFADADIAYAVSASFVGANLTLDLDMTTGVATTASTFVAGAAQVETATAAGTASAGGNVTVTVTAAGMGGSPLAIQVPVLNGDTAAVWAAKVRALLLANTAVSGRFAVSGETTAIILTRKSVDMSGTPVYFANDAGLNIAIANGSPDPGITPAATSANTTEGTVTSGIKIVDGDGKDFEGVTLPTAATILGLLVLSEGGGRTLIDGHSLTFTSITKGIMTVTGTLTEDGSTPLTINPLFLYGERNGRPEYRNFDGFRLSWLGTVWNLTDVGSSDEDGWIGGDDVPTPDLNDWADTAQSPATGVPSIDASTGASAGFTFEVPPNGRMLLTGGWVAPDVAIKTTAALTTATIVVIAKSS